MTIHFRDDVEHGNDATLRVIRGGMRGGAAVRIDLHADKRRGGYLSFSLTPREVEMLRAVLAGGPPEAPPQVECFDWPTPDHVPGCEHDVERLRATYDPPRHDPLDDPVGAGEPA